MRGKLNNLISKPHFPQKRERLELRRAIVRIKGLSKGIGS